MILPRAAAKNYHGRELFQWSLNLEHPLDLLQVVVETMRLDTCRCRDLPVLHVCVIAAFWCFCIPVQSLSQDRPVTKRAWAKAVWGKYPGEKMDGDETVMLSTRKEGELWAQGMQAVLSCKV